jgi:hypothetical protein
MDTSENNETRVPDFTVKADAYLEFQDTCQSKEEIAAYNAAHPRRKPIPREPLPDGRIPDWVEIVDEVLEFEDVPLPLPKPSLPPTTTNGTPSRTSRTLMPPPEPEVKG